eukprot:g16170.t1
MLGNTGGTPGGDTGFGAQPAYQTRSRGRGRHEAQEERFVEGDLFGSTKRPSFRSTEVPSGLPPRAAYYDGSGGGGGGGGGSASAFRNGGYGNGGAQGGYSQIPTLQASPFARGPTPTNAFFSGAGGGLSSAPGSVYGSARYSQVSPATGPRPTAHQQGCSPDVGGFGRSSGEVALVPVESGGGERNVMDDDDDDDMPTRSLADLLDIRDDGDNAAAEGLRYRRGGAVGGGRGLRVGGGSGDILRGGGGGIRAERPDTQRATWVVVWGVPPGSATEVLTRFLQFGHVEEQRGQPGSNWLYLKYATRLQAEKALAAGHGSRLTDTVMLGVQRISDDETWQSLREGRIPPLNAAQPMLARVRAPPGRATTGDAMEVDDADLLGTPPQRPSGDRSVCGRIMALFGFY